ncbi:hypothetical protein CLIB1444_15S01574 [[Candida] jaroonii]|uniref:Uncharacterized protein n=1 Tax=[Candida] jaroonii TaxID=467808 RepID=A0ACA9YEW2_9ASCO|nr:hypothetical protein CLIB1444_15S01574 [[Candida] jaroonii]
METVDDDVTFQYANECDLEIHCSPFGLSGLYIKIKGTNLMGIGSTMGLITGSTKGLIHYNDSQDLMDQKYKLYCIVEDDGMLRIDFTKISPLNQTSDEITPEVRQQQQQDRKEEQAKLVRNNSNSNMNSTIMDSNFSHSQNDLNKNVEEIIGKSPNSINTNDNSSYSSSLKSPNQGQENDTVEEDELPSLIFRGKCPDGRPDNIEPFIGIFSFERED